MSKILCTLAFYHDGGTLKPQLVFSCNPVTNLVMKGTDWKSARISNTNSSAGARDRFEYSFTGGKSVTRCSLVMNTSAILPPLVWLSKHPCGPPTKTGPRGPPGLKEDAKRKQLEEYRRREAKRNPNRIEGHRSSRNSSLEEERQKMLEEHGIYEPRNDREAREESRRLRLEDRIDSPRDYAQIADRDARREERQKRLRGSSSASSSDPYAMSGIPDRETRRQERLKRLRSSSSASESSDSGGGDRYRRSNRHSSGRDHRRYHGGDYVGHGSGRHDIEEEGLGDGGDGGGGGDGGV